MWAAPTKPDGEGMEPEAPCEPLNLVKQKSKPVAVVAPSAPACPPEAAPLLKIPRVPPPGPCPSPLQPDGLYSMIQGLMACEHKFLTTLYMNGLVGGAAACGGLLLSDVYRSRLGMAPVLDNLLAFANTQQQLWQLVGPSPFHTSPTSSSSSPSPCVATAAAVASSPSSSSAASKPAASALWSSSLDQKNSTSSTTEGTKNQDSGQNSNAQDKKKPHIKKPLNAFMLYMKEMRAKVVAECTLKESAAINQILGRRWHSLTREEQAKYYEKARQERQLHMQLYPGWSARDNYGYGAKKKKRKKERATSDQGGTSFSVALVLEQQFFDCFQVLCSSELNLEVTELHIRLTLMMVVMIVQVMWHALGREEQAKYYELARRERQLHMQLYPDWSSRANSTRGKKRKRKQETNDGVEHEASTGDAGSCILKNYCSYMIVTKWLMVPVECLSCLPHASHVSDCQVEACGWNYCTQKDIGAMVAEQLDYSPPIKENGSIPVQFTPDFRKWELCQTMPSVSGNSMKKCRARYGLDQQSQWCKPCR
ncbi:hypothetical protein PR048_018436 [Dryococelus australis]|uniref:HMG box domain-containing protein n=1 Tax=Dryococelus australis TaxID=614101 RepID=A0ABQ9HCG6_9NEOP|nr:hypothetical protein PR048_018436 [Dryococelus australis]